ncbi:hypothetical protein IJD15_03830 [bacterium]|nr:hypothetical protein [bacterium]
MQVSLSPSVQNYNKAQARPTFKANVLESVINNNGKMLIDTFQNKPVDVKEKTLTEKEKTELQAKRVKSAVKRLIGVILFADILYFAMKRSFKYTKIDQAAKKVEQAKKIIAPPVIPPPAFDIQPVTLI